MRVLDLVWAASLLLLGNPLPALPEDSPPVPQNLNIPMKTLGGRQFWSDVYWFHGWRIQKNFYTGHYRLLDDSDVRHAWGSYIQCRTRLNDIRVEQKLPDLPKEVVVLVHGIFRSSKSMHRLREELAAAGMTVVAFDYPSTRVPVEDAADSLHAVLQSLEGVEKIHLVAFSLGGLVTRSCLERHPDERIGRTVLVGTPNSGAEFAHVLRDFRWFKVTFGPAGQQLSHRLGVAGTLAPPPGEFAVIAGARNTPKGYNPLIPGDDDSTVSVKSARLKGAVDSLIVPTIHSLLINDRRTVGAVSCFLQTGRLRPEGDPEPVE